MTRKRSGSAVFGAINVKWRYDTPVYGNLAIKYIVRLVAQLDGLEAVRRIARMIRGLLVMVAGESKAFNIDGYVLHVITGWANVNLNAFYPMSCRQYLVRTRVYIREDKMRFYVLWTI